MRQPRSKIKREMIIHPVLQRPLKKTVVDAVILADLALEQSVGCQLPGRTESGTAESGNGKNEKPFR